MKKNQFQRAGFVFAKHPIRAANTTRRAVMFNHKQIKSGNRAIIDISKRWALASINQANWQMPQNINDMLSNALFQHRCQLSTNTGKAGGRRKKLKYLGGALWVHDFCLLIGWRLLDACHQRNDWTQAPLCLGIITYICYFQPAICCCHLPASRFLKKAKPCIFKKTGIKKEVFLCRRQLPRPPCLNCQTAFAV